MGYRNKKLEIVKNISDEYFFLQIISWDQKHGKAR
jgi:hypothetical protein